jgi:hypothetical protein
MARIIVMPDPVEPRDVHSQDEDIPVLLDERVYPVHLLDQHAAGQLIQRLAWAVGDAEARERVLG